MGKGNIENLIKNSDLTPEERKKKASDAGKASGEARAKRKLLKDELLALLEVKVKDGEFKNKTAREVMSAKLISKAMDGDIEAFKTVRDSIGEKPTDKVDATVKNDNQELLREYLDGAKNGVFTKR